MTKMIYMVVLILMQFVLGSQAQNQGQCLGNLARSINAGGNVCSAEEEFIRCYFVALNIPTSSFSETDLTNMKNMMETNLTAVGIHCDFDMKAIMKKINEDESNSATRTTQKPTDYDSASTEEDCINVFTAAITKAGNFSCPLVTPFLKCLIRVSGLYEYASNDAYSNEYSSMETKLEKFARSYGPGCIFDVKKLSKEVAREQKSKNSEPGLHTSVRGKMSFYALAVAAWICSYYFL
ncbi:hypothetical protein BsWGS_09452 [Bradybaena similaris]